MKELPRQKPMKIHLMIIITGLMLIIGSFSASTVTNPLRPSDLSIEDHVETSSGTETITDMFNREVVISDPVDSVVGTGAGALRYIVYMNGTEKVVGVENIERDEEVDPETEMRPYNLAHPELRNLPSIGPIWGGDEELIAAANPDVVITTNYDQAGDLNDLQTSLGIPVIGLVYGDLDENLNLLWEGLNITSRVLGTYSDVFLPFKSYVEGILSDLNSRTEEISDDLKDSCYVGGIGYRGVHGIGSTKPGYDPFDLINAKNVAAELGGTHHFVDSEQILTWDPDKLFIDGGGFAMMLDDLESGIYDTLQSVVENQIYAFLPYNWYTANFANTLIDAYYAGTVLFPDEFSDVDINETAAEIYEQMVGVDVFDTIMRNFKNSEATDQDALARLETAIDLGQGIAGYWMPVFLLLSLATLGLVVKFVSKRSKLH